jgi:hypothetical protein
LVPLVASFIGTATKQLGGAVPFAAAVGALFEGLLMCRDEAKQQLRMLNGASFAALAAAFGGR